MGQPAEKKSRRQFIIEALQRVERDQYADASVQGCLSAIRPVFDQILNGPVVFAQVEKLVQAKNADRAIKLVEVMPFKSKHIPLLLAMVGVVVSLVVAVVVLVLGQSGS